VWLTESEGKAATDAFDAARAAGPLVTVEGALLLLAGERWDGTYLVIPSRSPVERFLARRLAEGAAPAFCAAPLPELLRALAPTGAPRVLDAGNINFDEVRRPAAEAMTRLAAHDGTDADRKIIAAFGTWEWRCQAAQRDGLTVGDRDFLFFLSAVGLGLLRPNPAGDTSLLDSALYPRAIAAELANTLLDLALTYTGPAGCVVVIHAGELDDPVVKLQSRAAHQYTLQPDAASAMEALQEHLLPGFRKTKLRRSGLTLLGDALNLTFPEIGEMWRAHGVDPGPEGDSLRVLIRRERRRLNLPPRARGRRQK
jgi:hypothetical protein